jgi:hypothetical protein
VQEGHTHLSGLDEAVIKNVEACKQLSKITRTSLGPNGAPRPLALENKKTVNQTSFVDRNHPSRSTFSSNASCFLALPERHDGAMRASDLY